MTTGEQTTTILRQLREGDARAADRLLPLVYNELHRLAESYFRHQNAEHTLQPTALVHEAYLKLIDQSATAWQDKAHFLAVGAKAMRQILIDHARSKRALKRRGDRQRVEIDDPASPDDMPVVDLLALNEALERLSDLDERQAQVVELRFFGGLSVHETGEALGVSDRTVELDWRMAKAWLSQALGDDDRR